MGPSERRHPLETVGKESRPARFARSIRDVFDDTRSILEPDGALSIADLKAAVAREGLSGQTLVAIATGANIDFGRLRDVARHAECAERVRSPAARI